MAADTLSKELITDPSLWRIIIEISPDAVETVMYCPTADNSLIHRSIPIDTHSSSHLLSVEDTIYENPLLLSDFGRTDILLDTNRFIVAPSAISDPTLQEAIIHELWAGDDNEIFTSAIPGSPLTILASVDPSLWAFVKRTFPTATINHRLMPMIANFYNSNKHINSQKLYANLRGGRIDVILLNGHGLQGANTFAVTGVEDIVYYILSMASNSGFDTNSDEIFLCGDNALRTKVTETLRKYAKLVMPAVFPSMMYTAGNEAMQSPLELILLPLCE